MTSGIRKSQRKLPPPGSSQFPPVEERQIGGAPASTDSSALNVPNSDSTYADSSSVGSVVESIPPSTGAATQGGVTGGPAIVGLPIEAVPSGGVIALPNDSAPSPAAQPSNASNTPLNETNETAGDNAIEATLSENDLYQQAFSLLSQSKHSEAIEVFTQQIEDFPYGEYADDANYWITESKYVNRDLDEAKKYFKVIMDEYKQSPRLPDAMLKTAYIEAERGNKIEARLLLQDILQFHPRTNAAISAKNRLAELDS